MNEEIGQRWVAALRSGKYQQTQEELRRSGLPGYSTLEPSYCCLGVLCDLYLKEVGGFWIGDSVQEMDGSFETTNLPVVVKIWADMDNDVGTLKTPIMRHDCFEHASHDECDEEECSCPGMMEDKSLIELNDEAGYDFEQIADVIEAQFLGGAA